MMALTDEITHVFTQTPRQSTPLRQTNPKPAPQNAFTKFFSGDIAWYCYRLFFDTLTFKKMSVYTSVRSSEEKVVITWQDLQYETMEKDPEKSTFLKTAYRKKTILNNLAGHAQTKELLAIMGPTGCG